VIALVLLRVIYTHAGLTYCVMASCGFFGAREVLARASAQTHWVSWTLGVEELESIEGIYVEVGEVGE